MRRFVVTVSVQVHVLHTLLRFVDILHVQVCIRRFVVTVSVQPLLRFVVTVYYLYTCVPVVTL